MRALSALLILVFLALSRPAQAAPDAAFTQAFETYIGDKAKEAAVAAQRSLTHAEWCGIFYRSVEHWKAIHRDFEKRLTLDALLRLRRQLRECEPHKAVTISYARDRGAGQAPTPRPPYTSSPYQQPEPTDWEAARDFVKWHPDEFKCGAGTTAEQAMGRAEFKWEAEHAADMKRLEEAEANARAAKAAFDESVRRGDSQQVKAQMQKNLEEAERELNEIRKKVSDGVNEARDRAHRCWVRDHVPQGTAQDMSPITTSGEGRTTTRPDGSKVTEYDNGAKSIEHPNGTRETINPDGSTMVQHPDGHVTHTTPDGTIECVETVPEGILRIVSKPNGDTDYYLNGEFVGGYMPDLGPQFFRYVGAINPRTGLTSVQRYPPMMRFWHWLDDQHRAGGDRAPGDYGKGDADYLLKRMAEFKAAHPGVFDDESFSEFVDRRKFEIGFGRESATGVDDRSAEQRDKDLRQILDEWNAKHPESEMTLGDLIDKRVLEAQLAAGTVGEAARPLWLDNDALRAKLGAYEDWLAAHPNPTQDEERERRIVAAELRRALEAKRRLFEDTVRQYGGEEALRKVVGEERFRAMKAEYEALPRSISDKASPGSVDPLSDNWPGPRPQSSGASFSSLDGTTRINGVLTGGFDRIVITAVDGRQIPQSDRGVRITRAPGGDIILTLAPSLRAARAVVTGPNGSVILQTARPGPMGGAVSPFDGVIDLRNGSLRETLRVSPAITDTAAPVARHVATAGLGAPDLGTVAVREGEVAVARADTAPPVSGRSDCTVTGPGGQSATTMLPTWGYEFNAEPVVAVNQLTPIYFKVAGLAANERLRVTFAPTPTQEINPLTIDVRAGDFALMRQIGQYRAPIEGPQPLAVVVERLP